MQLGDQSNQALSQQRSSLFQLRRQTSPTILLTLDATTMSGIEAAGIALAIFPILIDGLNHVADGIETVKRWKRYKIKLQQYADF